MIYIKKLEVDREIMYEKSELEEQITHHARDQQKKVEKSPLKNHLSSIHPATEIICESLNLQNKDLSELDLSDLSFRRTLFCDSILRDVTLDNTWLDDANFTNAKELCPIALSRAKWENVIHHDFQFLKIAKHIKKLEKKLIKKKDEMKNLQNELKKINVNRSNELCELLRVMSESSCFSPNAQSSIAFEHDLKAELGAASVKNKLSETALTKSLPKQTITAKQTGSQNIMKKFTLQTLFSTPSSRQIQPPAVDLLCKAAHQEFHRVLAQELLPLAQSQKLMSKMPENKRLTIFISYAWATPDTLTYEKDYAYQYYVEKMAEDLEAAGFNILLDKWQDRRGKALTDFVEKVVDKKTDFIIPVGTKLYLLKYEKRAAMEQSREHVVRIEGQLLNYLVSYSTAQSERIIPILLEGTAEESLPPLLRHKLPLILADNSYFEQLFILIRDLYRIEPRDVAFNQLVSDFKLYLQSVEQQSTEEFSKSYQAQQDTIQAAQKAQAAQRAQTQLLSLLNPSPSPVAMLQRPNFTEPTTLSFVQSPLTNAYQQMQSPSPVNLTNPMTSQGAVADFNRVIINLLAKAKEYKASPEPDVLVLIEVYGFALALSRQVSDEAIKKKLEDKIVNAIEQFVFKKLRGKQDIGLANFADNFRGFQLRLENFRAEAKEDLTDSGINSAEQLTAFLAKNQASFEELINDIFEYLHGIVPNRPKTYAILSVGSLATQMVTPYSDIEYVVLVDEFTDEAKTYFTNFGDLFELIMIGLGESPINKARVLLKDFEPYFKYIKKGARVDEHKKPQDMNRLFGLINSPQVFLQKLPDNIIYQKGNHLTAALLTVGQLDKHTNEALYGNYRILFERYLPTKEYHQCLQKLLEQGLRECTNHIAALKKALREQKPGERQEIEIKKLLVHPLHLVRELAVFLRCCGENITLAPNPLAQLQALKQKGLLTDTETTTWSHLITRLFRIRLELQMQSDSAEAKLSLNECNDKLIALGETGGVKGVCNQLESIAKLVERYKLERKTEPTALIQEIVGHAGRDQLKSK